MAITAIGLTLFVIVAIAFPFRDRIFSQIYPKPEGFASRTNTFVCNVCSADIDKNKIVGPADVTVLDLCLNKKSDQLDSMGNPCQSSDVNRDGIVNINDLDCVEAQFRQICE